MGKCGKEHALSVRPDFRTIISAVTLQRSLAWLLSSHGLGQVLLLPGLKIAVLILNGPRASVGKAVNLLPGTIGGLARLRLSDDDGVSRVGQVVERSFINNLELI